MDDMNAFERLVAGRTQHHAGPVRPVDDAAIFAAITAAPSREWRLSTIFGALRFVAAGIIVAAFGGLLLSGVLHREPEAQPAPAAASADATMTAEPATKPTITFPQELPPGSRRGTLETDAGPVEWIRISAPSFPEAANGGWLGQLVPWDDGIAAWSARGAKKTLVSTTDGVAWQREELPSEPDIGEHWSAYGDPGLGVVDGTAYLVLSESGQVWVRQPDGGQWAQLDTSTIGDAMLGDGWSRRRAASDPVKVDDLIYFEITEDYTLPRKQLGIPFPYPTTWLTQLDEDRFELCSSTCDGGDERFKRTLRFDETEAGLRVADDRTGEVLGVIEGATRAELYAGDEGRHTMAFIIDGARVVRVDPLAGGPPETGGTSPPPPAGTAPEFGNEWLLREASDAKWTDRWVSIGDEWVSLRGVVERSQRYLLGARTGNVIALIGDDQEPIELWLLKLPEGA